METKATTETARRVRRFECCCCGGPAPAFDHWWNRDTGYGLCGGCAAWMQARPDYDPEEFTRNYGHAGTHWFPLEATTMIERTPEDEARFHSDMARLRNTFEVWHRDQPNFLDNGDDVLATFPAGFTHVATVQTDEVGKVFQLTNSIDRGWWENPEVVMVRQELGGARSTSVGDVIVRALPVGANGDGRPKWERWSIQMIGLRAF